MKFNITPGQWRVEKGTTLVWGACDPEDPTTNGMGFPVAKAKRQRKKAHGYIEIKEAAANARAIAAVPDMIEALSFIANNSIDDTARDFAEKVLVKAGRCDDLL